MSAPIRGQRRRGTPSLVLPGDPDACGWYSEAPGVFVPCGVGAGHLERPLISVRYVGRSSGWGNPWSVTETTVGWEVAHIDDPATVQTFETNGPGTERSVLSTARHASVRYHRRGVDAVDAVELAAFLAPLVAADVLSCWCPLDAPCHGDTLCDLVGRLRSGDLVPGLVATPDVCGGALRIECTDWSVVMVADEITRFGEYDDWTSEEAVYALAADLEVDPDLVEVAARVGGAL